MGIGLASSNKIVEFVLREYVFVWSIIAAAGTLLVLAAMPAIGQAAVIAVVLGGFCGSAWVSGYVLLQENVTDEFRGGRSPRSPCSRGSACSCRSRSSRSSPARSVCIP